VGFAAGSLKQIDDGYRNSDPFQQAASLKPPLTGDQPALGSNDHRVKQTDIGDAVGQRLQVAEVLPVGEANFDLVNGKSWPVHESRGRTYDSLDSLVGASFYASRSPSGSWAAPI
jgi:hypothetical protein